MAAILNILDIACFSTLLFIILFFSKIQICYGHIVPKHLHCWLWLGAKFHAWSTGTIPQIFSPTCPTSILSNDLGVEAFVTEFFVLVQQPEALQGYNSVFWRELKMKFRLDVPGVDGGGRGLGDPKLSTYTSSRFWVNIYLIWLLFPYCARWTRNTNMYNSYEHSFLPALTQSLLASSHDTSCWDYIGNRIPLEKKVI